MTKPGDHEPINLDRRPIVASIEGADASREAEALFDQRSEGFIDEVDWLKLLNERRVVLLVGPAHCGKTSELKLLRKRLWDAARVCFFLDMAVVVHNSVEDALGSEVEAFDEWREGESEAVFLLDALDEAELCDGRALSICLLKMSSKLSARGVNRSRFVISSRPGAWSTHDVLKEVREHLAAPARTIQASTDEMIVLEDEAAEKIAPDALCVASLPSLKPAQLDRLLRKVHGVDDPAKLRKRAWQLGLGFGVRSPGSLRWLVPAINAIADGPAGRLEGYEAAVREQARSAFDRRTQWVTVPETEFVRDLERLCAAAHFGQTYVFALQGATDLEGAASLRELLAHREVAYEEFVHSSPFFLDAGLQRIKWFPDELLPFLAARWLATRISKSELSADDAFEQLFLQTSFAGEIVPSQLEVTAGWLASMNAQFARRLIGVAPHAAFLYGDLGKLSLEVARGAFAATKKALLQGRALFFRTVRLTPDDFYQAMRPELTKEVVAAFDEADGNLYALDLLIRLVTNREVHEAVPALRKLLGNPTVSEHTLPRLMDALGECGTAQDVEWAVDELFKTGRMSKRVVTRAFESLLQRSASVDHLRRVIATGFLDEIAASLYTDDRVLDEPDKRAAFAVFGRLLTACARPNGQRNDESISDDGEDNTASQRIPLTALAAGLRALLVRHDLEEADLGQLIDWLEQLRVMQPGSNHDRFEDIRPLVSNNARLRLLALRRLLVKVRSGELPWLAHTDDAVYVVPDSRDIPLIRSLQADIADENRRAGMARLLEQLEPRQPARPPSPPKARTRATNATPAAVAKVQEGVEALRHAGNIVLLLELVRGVLPDDERHLRRRWRELADTYGQDVSNAVRQGLRQLWRAHPPLEVPDRPNEIFALTIAGLLGLEEELANPVAVQQLSEDESVRALHYSLFNSNSFPNWVNLLIEIRFDLCDDFFGKTIANWAASPGALRHARSAIAWMPPRLAREGPNCRRAAWEFMRSGDWDGQPGLERLLDMLGSNPQDPALTIELSGCAQLAWLAALDGWVPLITAWARADPGEAIQFMAKEAADAERHRDFIALASYWSLHDEFPLEGRPDDGELAGYLEQLYLLLSTVAPAQGDDYKVGVFTPTNRDNAAQMRSALLTMIEKVGGYPAYAAFTRLARQFRDDPESEKVFVTHATKVAEAAALPAKWSTTEFVKYADDVAQLPVSTEQALWRRVTRDLRATVRNVQHGRFHVGRLLALGKERDMQLWMARELDLHARGAYSVTREGELANLTMPDLVGEAAGKQITLELKIADARSVRSLLEDLEQQLLNDYMGDVRSNFGLFVVMAKNSEKTFPYRERRIGVVELQKVLQARADELNRDTMGRGTVNVVVFSLTQQTRAKFRRRAGGQRRQTPSRSATTRNKS